MKKVIKGWALVDKRNKLLDDIEYDEKRFMPVFSKRKRAGYWKDFYSKVVPCQIIIGGKKK